MGTSHTDHMAYTDGVRCISIQTHTDWKIQEPSSQEIFHFVEVWHYKITSLHKIMFWLKPRFLAIIIFMQDVKLLPYPRLFCYTNMLLKITLRAKHYYRHEINSYHILNGNVQARGRNENLQKVLI